MLVSGERTMALYCPACEQLQYHCFSLFEVSASPLPFQCECGFIQGHLVRKNQLYEVRLLCPSGSRARLLYSFREFWMDSLLTFYSPEEDDVLGFIGADPEIVNAAVADYDNELLQPEDFLEPEIMSAILVHLQKLAVANKIGCKCKQPAVGIDVYPDKVELVCSNCGSALLMGAMSEEDLLNLYSLSEIKMQPASHTDLGEWLKPLR